MSSHVAFYEGLTGTGDFLARFLGRRAASEGDKYSGKFGSPEFFTAALDGNEAALRTMTSKGYGHVWKVPLARKAIRSEIIRNNSRSLVGKMVPRGILTGSPMIGLNRARTNFHSGALKMGIGLGALTGIFSMATAPKGKMAQRGVENVGMTAGGILGAAAGGALLGLPGEILGGFIGGSLGEKAGKLIAPLEDLSNQSRHTNFGGNYQDSEPVYSMRQRAVAEMSTSLLNARQYLGKEALLFHE